MGARRCGMEDMDIDHRIAIAGPWITELEIEYVTEAVATNWYDSAGDFLRRFEAAFAAATGRRYALSLPSATSGIHLSLRALGIGPGDEVIVPEITWIASAAPVTYVGATPVFADVDPMTWCISAESIEENISSRTKAVIPVGLYGGMPDMDSIVALAESRGVAVIEDAAEAIGSMYRGRPAGSFGATSVFSFHGSKTLTTGEGGMVLTDDEYLYERMQVLRDHGRCPGDQSFTNREVGFKYKMSAMQAALGLAQLERVAELVGRKRTIFSWYVDAFADLAEVTLNAEPQGVTNSYWMTTIVLDRALGIQKVDLSERLGAVGIDSRPFFNPLSSLRAYNAAADSARAQKTNRISYEISPYGLNLPSALRLDEADVAKVVSAVRAAIKSGPSSAAGAGRSRRL